MPSIGAIVSTEIISASASFVISDWTLEAGNYIINVDHNLDSTKINNLIWENDNDQVAVDRVTITNQNTIKLIISADPDCRFAGTIIIFKVQEQ